MGPMFPRVLLFQSTSPARGTTEQLRAHAAAENISIHVPREGDDVSNEIEMLKDVISIHVPREGDDAFPHGSSTQRYYFNPRPPRGGRPLTKADLTQIGKHFNPRPPQGGRRTRH